MEVRTWTGSPRWFARLTAQEDDAPVRLGARRYDLSDLAEDLNLITGARRPRPRDLDTRAYDAPGDGRATLDEQPHGDRGRVPAAGGEAAKQRLGGCLLVEVEGLRVELAREPLNLVRVHDVLRASEALSDAEIV